MNQMKILLARQKSKSEEIQSKNEIQALNEADDDIISLQLIRKIMKVNFIQALDKARRKSRRYL